MSHGLKVLKFAAVMEEKLIANDHKGGWGECSLDWLLNRLRQETGELAREVEVLKATLDPKAVERVLREAADVANFAMMVSDNAQAYLEYMTRGKT